MKDREKMDAYSQFAVSLQRMKDAEFMRGLEAGKSALQCVFIWMQGVDGDGNQTTRDDLIRWTRAEIEKLNKRTP